MTNDTSSPVPPAPLSRSIQGIWKLKSRIDIDSTGQRKIDPVLGPDPLGMLCFSSKHFASQFMKRERSGTGLPTPAAPTKNNTGAVDGYDAYFGTYTIDEVAGTFTIHLEGSILPANIGKSFVRNASVAGDELTIELNTTATDGTPVTRTLKFSRLH